MIFLLEKQLPATLQEGPEALGGGGGMGYVVTKGAREKGRGKFKCKM